MKRREFVKLLGGASLAWPLAAHAQQTERMRRVSVLMPYVESNTDAQQWTKAFAESLQEIGWIDGKNILLEFRWAGPSPDRLRADAAGMVRLNPDVLMATSTPSVVALQHETRSIPIVFANVADPVGQGVIASFAKPGGNTTGFGAFEFSIGGKWVTSVIAALVDPNFPEAVVESREVEEAGRTIGQKIVLVNAGNEREFDAAFTSIVQAGVRSLVVTGSPFFTSKSQTLVALAAHHAIPAIYDLRDYVAVGGLISYAASFTDAYRQAGVYAGRILKGAKPSELPVLQPTAFELAINLKTAKALGLTFPPSFRLRADEVIE